MTTKSFLNSEETSKLVSDSEELNKALILGFHLTENKFL